LFGPRQCVIDIARRTVVPANAPAPTIDVVVCTAGDRHLLNRLPLAPRYFTHHPTGADPRRLGFECHAVLRDRLSDGYDYCYLEDDLILRDPLFFAKLRWFTWTFGEEAVLMPNRYEVARNRPVEKAYVDGPIRPQATAAFQNLTAAPALEAETLGKESRSSGRPTHTPGASSSPTTRWPRGQRRLTSSTAALSSSVRWRALPRSG
jgi:hypothetical protein